MKKDHNTIKLTVAQAIIKYLKNQYVERDGKEMQFFEGCLGIFGHGNVAGIGQALAQNPDFKYIMTRNEQASVHMAIAHAKMKNRMGTYVCTSSIGPGATNMVTGAACATINRLPVLLLLGDIFSSRQVAPVLQQLESAHSQDISVNNCFKPVSKYWDRINRPEQIITALPEAMRVLTSPAETGAVTLSLPQDVQTEAYDFPQAFFAKRVWKIPRIRPDKSAIQQAAECIKKAKHPLIISGGGCIYSEATETLEELVNRTGIPVAETFAGKGALSYNHPLNLGAVGATGTPGANDISSIADVIIGIGTRYSDFTTASKTAFQNPNVKFININVAEFDAYKHNAIAITGDAKCCILELQEELKNFSTSADYQNKIKSHNQKWDEYVENCYQFETNDSISQVEIIGAVNRIAIPDDVVLCAAGSLPGDLHKLWRATHPKAFHLEYGYSTMGYECAAGFGAKTACPDKEIWVMVGDGNYLMMNSDIITSIQEGVKYNIVLIDNHGYKSIGALSESIGSQRFGTKYRYRDNTSNQLTGDILPVDFVANAKSLGATVIHVTSKDQLIPALQTSKRNTQTTIVVVEADLEKGIPGYGWWEVAIAQTSEDEQVNNAYKEYLKQKEKQRYYF